KSASRHPVGVSNTVVYSHRVCGKPTPTGRRQEGGNLEEGSHLHILKSVSYRRSAASDSYCLQKSLPTNGSLEGITCGQHEMTSRQTEQRAAAASRRIKEAKPAQKDINHSVWGSEREYGRQQSIDK
ncbi:unnamed protein product, partial [Protopolystoma xenopodis]